MTFTRRYAAVATAALVALAVASSSSSAQPVTLGPLTLSDLWSRATPPGAPTAGGYLTIANSGSEPDRLIAVATRIAGVSGLHRMEVADGVMTMRPVEGGIEIPAGGTVTLAPGGLHIMFMALKEPPTEGGMVPVTFTFEKAGTVEAALHVMAIGAPGPLAGETAHEHPPATGGG